MALWMKALNQVIKDGWIDRWTEQEAKCEAGAITGKKYLLKKIKEMSGGMRCLAMGGQRKSD